MRRKKNLAFQDVFLMGTRSKAVRDKNDAELFHIDLQKVRDRGMNDQDNFPL